MSFIQIMKKHTQQFVAFVILVVLFVGAQTILAWTEPTVVPPGGNVDPPINTSAFDQRKLATVTSGKTGRLTLDGSLLVNNINNANAGILVQSGYIKTINGRLQAGDFAGTVTADVGLMLSGKKIRVVDGTEGDGKVLTSNANGLASWQPPTSVVNKCPPTTQTCTTLPDGVVINWGALWVADASKGVVVNLDPPYAAAAQYGVQITSTSYSQNCVAAVVARTNSSFTFQTDAQCNAQTFYWQSIGRP